MQLDLPVLRVNESEEEAAYTSAVSEILRNIQIEHRTTLAKIAAHTGISLKTVSNAANEKGVLNPLYLNRLGYVYGAHVLTPYLALAKGRAVSVAPDADSKVVPLTLAVATKLSAIDGALTRKDLFDVEAAVDAAINALSSLSQRAKLLRAA